LFIAKTIAGFLQVINELPHHLQHQILGADVVQVEPFLAFEKRHKDFVRLLPLHQHLLDAIDLCGFAGSTMPSK